MNTIPIYLDCNATTPTDLRVFSAMKPFFCKVHGNASSRDHAFGWDAAEAVSGARIHVANLINAKPNEIVFTSGATESISLALKGVIERKRAKPSRVVTCATEHDAVLKTCRQLKRLFNVGVETLAVDRSGGIDYQILENTLAKSSTDLVALMYANNEIGTIHPIQKFVDVAHESKIGFFSDITQAVGKIPVDVSVAGVDFAAFSAHKIYGPKGVGAFYIRGGVKGIELEPLIAGGGQEWGLRGGTLNVPGIVGFGEACRIAQCEMLDDAKRITKLRDKLEQALLTGLPDIWINGDIEHRLPNTSNIGFTHVNARELIREMHDIAVSTSSACSSASAGPSHVLKAIGLSDEQAYSSVRFSLGRFTTEKEIDYTISKVITSVNKLRK